MIAYHGAFGENGTLSPGFVAASVEPSGLVFLPCRIAGHKQGGGPRLDRYPPKFEPFRIIVGTRVMSAVLIDEAEPKHSLLIDSR